MKLTKLKKYNIINNNNNNKTKFKNRNIQRGGTGNPGRNKSVAAIVTQLVRPAVLPAISATKSASTIGTVTPARTTTITAAPTTKTAGTKKLLNPSISREIYTEETFAVSNFQNNYISALNGANTIDERIDILTKIDKNSFNIPNLRYMFDKYIKLTNPKADSIFDFTNIAQTGKKINEMISKEIHNTVRIYSRKMPLYEINKAVTTKFNVNGKSVDININKAYDEFLVTHHLKQDFDKLKTESTDNVLTIYMPQLLKIQGGGSATTVAHGIQDIKDIANITKNNKENFRSSNDEGWKTVINTNSSNTSNGNKKYYGITSGPEAFERAESYKIGSPEVRNFAETCNDLQILYITKHIELYDLFKTMLILINLNIEINDKIALLLDPYDNIHIFTGNDMIKLKSLKDSSNFINDALLVQKNGIDFSKKLNSKEKNTINIVSVSNTNPTSKKNTPANISTNTVESPEISAAGYNATDLQNVVFENSKVDALPITININDCTFLLDLNTIIQDTSLKGVINNITIDPKNTIPLFIILPEPIYSKNKIEISIIFNNNDKTIGDKFDCVVESNTVIKCIIDNTKLQLLKDNVQNITTFILTIKTLKKLQIHNLPSINSIPDKQVMYVKYTRNNSEENSAVVTVLNTDKQSVTLSHNVIINNNNKYLSNSAEVTTFINGFNDPANASTRSIEFLSYIIDSKEQYDTFQLIKNIQVENSKSLTAILNPPSSTTSSETPTVNTLEARITEYKNHTDSLKTDIITKTSKANNKNSGMRTDFSFVNVNVNVKPRHTVNPGSNFATVSKENLQASVYKCYDLQILYLIKHLEFTEMTKIIFYYYDMLIKKIGLLLFVLSLYTIQVSKTPKEQKENTILAIIDNMNAFLLKQHETVGKINSTINLSGGASPDASTNLNSLITETKTKRTKASSSGILDAVSNMAAINSSFFDKYTKIAEASISITTSTELNLSPSIINDLQEKYNFDTTSKTKIREITELNERLNLARTNYYSATIKCSTEKNCVKNLPELKADFIQASINLYSKSFLPDIQKTDGGTFKFIEDTAYGTSQDQVINICNRVAKIIKENDTTIPELLFMNVIDKNTNITKTEAVIALLKEYNTILRTISTEITTLLPTTIISDE